MFSLVFFCMFGFPEGFLFSKNLRGKKRKQKKTYPRVGLKHLKTLVSLVVFCMFGCQSVFWLSKNLRENQQTKKNKPISKGGSETFQNFVFLVFPKVFVCFLWFSFVCLVFPKVFCFLKTFGKTNKNNNKKQPISKGGSETFKNFGCFGFPKVVFAFLRFSFVCLVFPKLFQGGLDA